MNVTPVLLMILDGFGCRPAAEDNAITLAVKPFWDQLWAAYPHTAIQASEAAVGLPAEQMGNSEVGHLNIGAGRVVYQEISRINRSIASGSFFTNHTLTAALGDVKAADGALHIFGLLSDGGVHSHESHIHAMVDMAAQMGIRKICVHAFLDGRDTPPKECRDYLRRPRRTRLPPCRMRASASISGRYYAMDRDHRWLRVKAAYDMLTQGKAEFRAATSVAGLATPTPGAKPTNSSSPR